MQTIASIIKSYNAIIASPATDSPGQPATAMAPIRRPKAAISVHLHTKRSPAGRRASCDLSLRSQRHSSIGPERYTHRKGLLSYRPFGPFEPTANEPCRGLLTCQSLKFAHVTARPLSSCPHLLNCHLQSPFVLAGRLMYHVLWLKSVQIDQNQQIDRVHAITSGDMVKLSAFGDHQTK